MHLSNQARAVRSLRTAASAALLSIGFAGGAVAQEAAPAVDAAVAPESLWMKICSPDVASTQEICFTQAELRTDTGQFLASAGIREVDGGSRSALLVQAPIGVLIQPGVGVRIDQGPQVEAKFTICFQNACFAELPIEAESDFIGSLKRGGTLFLSVLNQQANAVNFEISLVGFTAAYDGPPLDLAAMEAERQRLDEQNERAAREMQERLIEAQRAAENPDGGAPAEDGTAPAAE